jgi:hypothetical protein
VDAHGYPGERAPVPHGLALVGGVIFEKYTDCKIDQLAVSGKAGEPLQVTLSFLGITSTFGSDESGNIIQTAPYLYMHGAGALKVDTVAYPIHALDLQVNNNLAGFQADGYVRQHRRAEPRDQRQLLDPLRRCDVGPARLPDVFLRLGGRHGADDRVLESRARFQVRSLDREPRYGYPAPRL